MPDAVAAALANPNMPASREAALSAARTGAGSSAADAGPSDRHLFRALLAARAAAAPSPSLAATAPDRSPRSPDESPGRERCCERERPSVASLDDDNADDDLNAAADSISAAPAAPPASRPDAPARDERETTSGRLPAVRPGNSDGPGKPAEAPPPLEATTPDPAARQAGSALPGDPTISPPPATPAPETIAAPTQGALRQASELAASLPAGTQLQARVSVSTDLTPAASTTPTAAAGSPLAVGSTSSAGGGTGAGGTPNGQGGNQPPPTPDPGSATGPGANDGRAGLVPGIGRLVAPAAVPTFATASAGIESTAAAGDSPAAPAGTPITGLSGTAASGGSLKPTVASPSAIATRSAALPQAVAHQVSVHITTAARGGHDHIEIQLQPESLGRVEVRLDVGADNRVSAIVLADSREALDTLRADARGLERALQDAGLKTDSGSLSFGLRNPDGGGGRGAYSPPQAPSPTRAIAGDDGALGPPISGHAVAGRTWAGDRRLDIHA